MVCNHETCNHPHIDHAHNVLVLDHHNDHREQTAHALLSFYNVLEYAHTTGVLSTIQRIRPGIMLIVENAPSHGAYELVRLLRLNVKTAKLPVIILLDEATPTSIAAVQECGADGWLAKPFPRSKLIRKISDLLNRSVEQEWQNLPAIQSMALRYTVEAFNNIADTIANGGPIAYDEVSVACEPLIEAVNANNFMGILNGVKNHDNYTYVHSLRVATMLTLFGNAINLPPHEQKILASGGLLHDIGKMAIPHSVLNKPGKLDLDEFEVMKNHVTATIYCLEQDPTIPKGIITIAAQHHEKLDGTGYPYSLGGTKLNDLARMAAIVDIFSAITDRRVYKAAMPAEQALAIMSDEMSHHIDTNLLGMFRERFLDALRTF